MNKRSIILDCGPLHQDALTMLWALSSKQLDVKAVTCVAEAQSMNAAVENAQKILTLTGRTQIPVAKGAVAPLVQHEQQGIAQQYAASRIANLSLPAADLQPSSKSALELMINVIEESANKVTICTTGPLTNVALLIATRPDLKSKIEQIAIAGGGAGKGNVTPAAEYAIFADPEAAHVIFHSGLDIMMAGLDVAHKAYVTSDEGKALRGKGTNAATVAADLLDELAHFTSATEDFTGSIVQGPCMIAALLEPELFQSIHTHVDIEIAGDLTRGMTIVNQVAFLEMPENATVVLNVDRAQFIESFMKAIEHIN